MTRLATRIAKMESVAGTTGTSEAASRMAVSLLARLDALFWPFRSHTGNYRAEVRALMRAYLAGTGGLRAAGQGATNWKAAHEDRNELIALGLVTAQLSGGQVTGLRLTPQGIADARAMVGDRLQTVQPALPFAAQVLNLRGTGHAGDWVLENLVFPDCCNSDRPNDWDHATEFALPLLTAGILKSGSDLWNRVYYLLVDDAQLPVEPPSVEQERDWADDHYIQTHNAERDALERLVCGDGGLEIPIRCT